MTRAEKFARAMTDLLCEEQEITSMRRNERFGEEAYTEGLFAGGSFASPYGDVQFTVYPDWVALSLKDHPGFVNGSSVWHHFDHWKVNFHPVSRRTPTIESQVEAFRQHLKTFHIPKIIAVTTMNDRNRKDFKTILWDDVSIGDEVYIDHYEAGKYPQANPRISGPYEVTVGNGTGRWLHNPRVGRSGRGRGGMHYPDNLLKREPYPQPKEQSMTPEPIDLKKLADAKRAAVKEYIRSALRTAMKLPSDTSVSGTDEMVDDLIECVLLEVASLHEYASDFTPPAPDESNDEE